MKSFSEFNIKVNASSGEVKTICPQCSDNRKKKGYPCLNVNIDKGVWHCWHCDWSGSLAGGIWREAKKRIIYNKPIFKADKISPAWREWLRKRGLSDTTIGANKITSGGIYMPQIEGEADAVCFPFFREGEAINAKYRDANKNFRMVAGAERLLYGFDDIDEKCLIWVEGEMDKLSLYEAGFKSCVSVPDGAPAINTKNYSSKFDYFEAAMDKLGKVEKHIIAVDSDAPGQTLKTELIRRLGAEKCCVATWPQGCKDANETLLAHGKAIVAEAIEGAKLAPVEGVFYLVDISDDLFNLYLNGEVGGIKTGAWDELDELYSVRDGDFTVVTGIPSHGKSEWVDALLVHLAKNKGKRYAFCSPENQPIHLHMKKLIEKWAGLPFFESYGDRMSQIELIDICADIKNSFSFILPEAPTIDCILDRARVEVSRRGINGLVIDPWNELEHSRPAGQSETEYISDSLRKMRSFARNFNIHLWIVAHPTKMQKMKDGSNRYDIPTPYDIAGSANWRNKADNCITVYRNDESVDVHVQKIRVKGVGRIGTARLKYKVSTGEYFTMARGDL